MKRFLPILTLALLGAAVTVFAVDEATSTAATSPSKYYHDYYLDPPNTEPVDNPYVSRNQQSDSFTYGTRDNTGAVIENPNVYTVARETRWDTKFAWPNSVKENYFRIDIPDANSTGEYHNKANVTLYLTDYVTELVPQVDYAYNSSTNALFNMGIEEYGYRVLTPNGDGTYTASEKTVSYDILVSDKDGEIIDSDGNRYRLSDKVTPIDSIDYNNTGNPEDYKIRYKYELGTFQPGSVIEVYLKDSSGREIYSFSSYEGVDENGESVFTPFDKTNPEINTVRVGEADGFGDGEYRVPQGDAVDKLLYNYYFNEDLFKDEDGNLIRGYNDYHDYTAFIDEEINAGLDPKSDAAITLASKRAMPLSHLTPIGTINEAVSLGKEVRFGFYGVVGSPLPGGLQIALIAGLFGLGFFYVRRRKAIAG